MKISLRTTILLISVLVMSCGQRTSIADNTLKDKYIANGLTYTPSIDSQNVTRIQLPDMNNSPTSLIRTEELIDSVWYLPLETHQESIISGIDMLRIHGDRIYVLDNASKSILMFDNQGGFIRQIGSAGKGPGEYINPISIVINEFTSELLIHDDKSRTVLIHDLEGNFLREKPVGFLMNYFAPLGDSAYLVNIYLRDNRHLPQIAKSQYLEVDTDWQIKTAGLDGSVNECSEFGRAREGIYPGKTDYLYNPTFSNMVYQYTAGKMEPAYYFDLGSMTLPDGFLCGLSFEDYIRQYDNSRSPYAFISGAIVESEHWLITTFRYQNMSFYLFYSKADSRYFWNSIYETDPKSPRFVTLTSVEGRIADDVFYGYKSALQIYNEIQTHSKTQRIVLDDKLAAVQPESNPVLVFYRLK